MERPQLPRKIMLYYASPHLTHAVATLPVALFVPAFYAADMGLPLAGVGMAIAASRALDMVSDPLIGILSDRLKTRWGRRKPWIGMGTPLLMLSAWMVFAPRGEVSLLYLFVWASLLFFAFTLVDLPHKAWGAELSTDYTERTRVAAWREGLGALGQILFLGVLSVMDFLGYVENRDQLRIIALVIVISLPPLVAMALAKVPEFPAEELAGEYHDGGAGIRLVLRNHAFMRTLITLLLLGTAVLIQATLHRLVLTHVVGRPDIFATMILTENLVSLAMVPVWMGIANRIGKHRAIILAALWIGLSSLGFPWVDRGDTVLYVSLIILRGSSLASIFMLANSIAADVVDHDIVASGRQRTGLFFAVWSMAIKLAVALGVLLGTALPAAFGFEPSAPVQAPEAKQWLLMIYGWLPCLIIALGLPIMWNFPIDRTRQQALRNEISARRGSVFKADAGGPA
ncbi:Na+/melibiose symporter-like transporter [Methylocaldum marinum]|uniref:Na+/melibiose symporter-like transporter n=1 Tax=Methylocaldum marinum TaxID=1432792 RepID=A0A250KN07_9GAMM|nr:MFS transporter [Methylocaldum marinum]BBA33083.1 Na+/melibiose symporter-like transporter [Methylocaldum marinum]